jgi:hypothetical protein
MLPMIAKNNTRDVRDDHNYHHVARRNKSSPDRNEAQAQGACGGMR